MRRWSLLVVLFVCVAWPGCSTEAVKTPTIVVSVKHDASLALTRITYRAFVEQADPARDAPYEVHAAEGAERDQPLVLERRREPRILLVVQGFTADDPRTPRVEHRVRAAFVPDTTLALRLYLSSVCDRQLCDAVPEQTCYFEPRAGTMPGSCGLTPGPYELPVITSVDQAADWVPQTARPPEPDAGQQPDAASRGDAGQQDAGQRVDAVSPADAGLLDAGSVPVDGGSMDASSSVTASLDAGALDAATGDRPCPLPDGGACNPVLQCGCQDGQRCLIRGTSEISCTALAPMPVAEGAACRLTNECAPGLSCRTGMCRKQCESDGDCTGGICDRFNRGFGLCYTPCGNAGEVSCPSPSRCTPIRFRALSRSYCSIPEDPCGFMADGECDEPLIGSGLCAAGTDAEDCCVADQGLRCDLLAQCGCGPEACAVTSVERGSAVLGCVPVGTRGDGASCTVSSECQRGLGCYGSSCKRHCEKASDCTSGLCIPLTDGSVNISGAAGVCLTSCDFATGAPCEGDSVCARLPTADVCFVRAAECGPSNGRCDEDTRICAPGTDVDCPR